MFPELYHLTCGKSWCTFTLFCEVTGVLYNENIEFPKGVASFLIASLSFNMTDDSPNLREYSYTEWPENSATVSASVNFTECCNNYIFRTNFGSIFQIQNTCSFRNEIL
jgi:hypothetical protein